MATSIVSAISSTKIPSQFWRSPQSGKKAMIEEIEALKKNDTWELITLPRGKRTVGCRWVYTLKHKADGSIERARIVAKGFTQTYSINYLETFAPVAKLNSLNSIRVILSVAANRSWPLHQLDVKRAFLHGDLHQGFELRGRKGKFAGEKRRYMVSSSLLGLGSRYEVWLWRR